MSGPIKANGTGVCPHCGKGVQFLPSNSGSAPPGTTTQSGTPPPGNTPNGWFQDATLTGRKMEVVTVDCPLCKRPIVALQNYKGSETWNRSFSPAQISHNFSWTDARLIWPPVGSRKPLPSEVPKHIADDYGQAALVLTYSEKASAALSRRCLQTLLREAGNTKARDLTDQIDEVLPSLPAYLQQQLDAVRNIGNFAAHSIKSKSTGEIVDVELGEAEWNLDVLDLLFDFYYEQPRVSQERRDALNRKLTDAGKQPMK